MPEQPRLYMFELQWLAQKRVLVQINLSDGEIIRRSPVRVNSRKFLVSQRGVRNAGEGIHGRHETTSDEMIGGTDHYLVLRVKICGKKGKAREEDQQQKTAKK